MKIAPLSYEDAVRHEARIEELVALIDGACDHEPGELVHGSKYSYKRWETSWWATEDEQPIGILLGCLRTPAEVPSPEDGSDFVYPTTHWFLAHLVIAPEYRGQGIGSQLLAQWLAQTRGLSFLDENLPRLWALETDGREESRHIRRFYKNFGFEVAGYRHYGSFVDPVMTASFGLEPPPLSAA